MPANVCVRRVKACEDCFLCTVCDDFGKKKISKNSLIVTRLQCRGVTNYFSNFIINLKIIKIFIISKSVYNFFKNIYNFVSVKYNDSRGLDVTIMR